MVLCDIVGCDMTIPSFQHHKCHHHDKPFPTSIINRRTSNHRQCLFSSIYFQSQPTKPSVPRLSLKHITKASHVLQSTISPKLAILLNSTGIFAPLASPRWRMMQAAQSRRACHTISRECMPVSGNHCVSMLVHPSNTRIPTRRGRFLFDKEFI
jgi:hypothetical protein